jgi:hypothetical protein
MKYFLILVFIIIDQGEAFAYHHYYRRHHNSTTHYTSTTTHNDDILIQFSKEEAKIFVKAFDKAAKIKNFNQREKEEFKELRNLLAEGY